MAGPKRGIYRAGAASSATAEATAESIAARQQLTLDLVGMALDLAGVVDPTPASDVASASLSLLRGNFLDAAISVVSAVPYIGDLAKAGKLPRYMRIIDRVVDLAKVDAAFARAVSPAMHKIEQLLDMLPSGINDSVTHLKSRVDTFFTLPGVVRQKLPKPDVSGSFKFSQSEQASHRLGTVVHKKVTGRLGVPGTVLTHDKKHIRSSVSHKSGDDASHLAGQQFGAPNGKPVGNLGTENLSLGNRSMNQGGGNWLDLEAQWAEKLKKGIGIEVEIVDTFKKAGPIRGSNDVLRPLSRKASWTEIYPDGTSKRFSHNVEYGNFETPASRAANPSLTSQRPKGASAQVIPLRKPESQ